MPQTYDFDLICLGSGPAGQRAVIQAAKLGKRAAVVERQQIVGGVCVATGTIPSKTFREAVCHSSRKTPYMTGISAIASQPARLPSSCCGV
jgi:NAD(P) transhydrogenase